MTVSVGPEAREGVTVPNVEGLTKALHGSRDKAQEHEKDERIRRLGERDVLEHRGPGRDDERGRDHGELRIPGRRRGGSPRQGRRRPVMTRRRRPGPPRGAAVTTGGVRGDDASSDFPATFNADLEVGDKYDFMQGLWTFTFSNYKLLPETMADVPASPSPIEDEFVPGTFALAQNFPNPFSGTTTIAFQVRQAGHVSLDVFDVMGRKVATVVNEVVSAGAHRATFEARDLAAGLYLVRLTAEGQVLQQKMTVVK